MKRLKTLLEQARPMTPQERAAQRESFAFGNVRLANERMTKAAISAAARRVPRDLPK